MKALIKSKKGAGGVGIQDVPVPQVREDEVLVRVINAGICGTDVHIYHDRFNYTPPVVLGHEFSGIVEELGPGVDSISVGSRVVSENNPFACGTCPACARGYPNICPQKRPIGIHSDGCFAEYVRLPAPLLHQIPPEISSEEAALMEPLAVAVHAVDDRSGVEQGDIVIVMGPGAIGLLAAQVARAEGAGQIVVAGTSGDATPRLACAAELGFDVCIVDDEDLTERVGALSAGNGADLVIEASGARAAVQQGIELLRRGGRMAVVGLTGRDQILVSWDRMVGKGLSVFFSFGSRRGNWTKGLDYLSNGQVQTLPLITDRMRLEDWPEGFRRLECREGIRGLFQISS
jgi:L-iditol 2-dehydrogenase